MQRLALCFGWCVKGCATIDSLTWHPICEASQSLFKASHHTQFARQVEPRSSFASSFARQAV